MSLQLTMNIIHLLLGEEHDELDAIVDSPGEVLDDHRRVGPPLVDAAATVIQLHPVHVRHPRDLLHEVSQTKRSL